MSFYSKSRLRVGPFRYELSGTDVSTSSLFPWLKPSRSPCGYVITVENNRTSAREDEVSHPNTVTYSSPRAEPEGEIDTANVLELQDSTSTDLILELRNKYKKAQMFPLVGFVSVATAIILIGLGSQPWVTGILLFLAVVLAFLSKMRDDLSKTTIVFYKLDQESESNYEALCSTFDELAACSKAWHIEASERVSGLHEWKRQAGASSVVQRRSITLKYQLPPFVRANVKTPSIPVGSQTLYFFPDRILVYEGKNIGTVPYLDMQIRHGNTRFIESGALPRDAQIVDHTWKYVNKKGGPDRRYKDNRQLPIALYSELYFSSQTGLNEMVQVSKPNLGQGLSDSIRQLGAAKSVRIEISTGG